MKRIFFLCTLLGLSVFLYMYRQDSGVVVQPVSTTVADTFLNTKDTALSVHKTVQNTVQKTINTFIVRTEEAPEIQPRTNVTLDTVPTEAPVVSGKGPASLEVFSDPIKNLAITVNGTIAQTNYYRRKEGLPGLSSNALLTLSAQKKVDDMFARQYFEHESPVGVGSDDLAHSVGYAYVMIGENLALGEYADDSELVQGWMNSPGHRENILNPKYTEIGVAVKKGMFNGDMVWLAVQEFGRPASDCPGVSGVLNVRIEEGQLLLEKLQQKLSDMRTDIETTTPASGSVYTQKVDMYNTLVHEYNVFVQQSKKDVETYNAQVKAHNVCVGE
ncbi:CAP domain-containing protein [Candidatus Campbellbacteria bacterium]|nr:MAG: CAP domain-containing protein [Candidatus Campbellbacteria bacterium]